MKMKDSGLEWLGDIPAHWKIINLKFLFKEHKCKNIGMQEKNLLSLSYGKIIRKNINTNEGLLPESFETYNIIEKGCIVFRLTDLQNDKHSLRTGLCKERGIITSAYLTIETTENDNAEFMHYLFHVYDVCKVFYNMGDGVRQSIKFNEMKNLPVLLPPFEEQPKISAYLDKKCAAIDTAVDAAKKMVVKLGEYKKALITETVTKGLNPAAEMQDSGVEWLGDIPAHWKICRLKFLVDNISKKNNYNGGIYVGLENIESWTGKINFTEFENENFVESILNSFEENFLLFGKLRPYLAKVAKPNFAGQCSSELLTFLPNEKICRNFLFYLMISHGFIYTVDSSTYGTKMPRASWAFIGNIKIPLSPIEEQKEISAYLDSKCAAIDENIAKHQQLAEKLTEYKKSLIYEVVTGKMEV